ncbi:hypothetical protein AAG906_020437 [Vitis piasezkii]
MERERERGVGWEHWERWVMGEWERETVEALPTKHGRFRNRLSVNPHPTNTWAPLTPFPLPTFLLHPPSLAPAFKSLAASLNSTPLQFPKHPVRQSWVESLAATKPTPTEVPGAKRKTTASSTTSVLMATDPGDLFPKPLVRLLRCGKSCRLRWINYLRPDVKRGNFAIDEDELIIKLHKLLGNKWSLIAGRLPGRTDNEIKNHWNTHIRRKLIRGGINPKTHQPTKPITTEETNCSSALTTTTTDNTEKPQQPPPKQQPNQFPGEEEEHINLELTLALFPTPSESTAESKLRRTTTPDGPDEGRKDLECLVGGKFCMHFESRILINLTPDLGTFGDDVVK